MWPISLAPEGRGSVVGRRARSIGVPGLIALCLLVGAPAAQAVESRNILDLAAELGATLEWDVLSSTAILGKEDDRLSFTLGVPWLVVNYRTRYPMEAAERREGGVYLSAAAVERVKKTLEARAALRWRIGVIMIDPGHGGIDPGTLDTHGAKGEAVTIREKDVVLAASLRLADLLRAELPDKRILLTRSQDKFVSLEARTEMANSVELGKNEAMIYLSIHANGGFNKKARGFEVWVYPSDERRKVLDQGSLSQELKDIWPILNSMREDEFNTQSAALAASILSALEEEVGGQTENRGLKRESWAVVREALMPAALVELGFVSNPEEARLLADPEYQSRLAAGVGKGIVGFVHRFEAAMSFLD
jgi:N-acetylmuramoyl-L-alanine amidase